MYVSHENDISAYQLGLHRREAFLSEPNSNKNLNCCWGSRAYWLKTHYCWFLFQRCWLSRHVKKVLVQATKMCKE